MSTLDKDLLATMTDEERAAIEETDEYTPDQLAAMQAIADAKIGDGDDGDEDAGDGAPADPPAKVEKPAKADDKPADDKTPEGDTPPADDKPAGETEADADDEPAQAGYKAELPADYKDKVAALKTRNDELFAKFKEGEIDADELQAGQAEIAAERETLLLARAKAEISGEMTAQNAQTQWLNAVKSFARATAKDGGIDYNKDEAKRGDWDLFIKHLAGAPENADKSAEWFLAEAHKRVVALHGLTPAKKPETVAQAAAARKPNLENAPKTIAQAPGADGPGDVAGEFAHIDALEGWELEKAIAAMSPAQREKYAKS
jgi:hypothetical protein